MRTKFSKIAQAATFGLAITFTLSCSSDDGGDDSGTGEGITYTEGIENLTGSSFTIVDKDYICRENGTLEEATHKDEISYSINGKTLSFWGIEFNGNSTSLIGTWTREAYSASCGANDYSCEDNNKVSKAVFTQNSVTYTYCIGGGVSEEEREDDDGIVIGKRKFIDCGTYEETRGTETVIVKYLGTETTATYRGKTCKAPMQHSESKMREACTEAYNKANAEGYDGSGYVVRSYYFEILNKDIIKCLKDNNFPEWFH